MDRPAATWYLKEPQITHAGGVIDSSVHGVGRIAFNHTPLHCDRYQQHVQALEKDVSSIAHPDVACEGHEEECCCPQAREGT